MTRAAFVLSVGMMLVCACGIAVAPKPEIGVALGSFPDLPCMKSALIRAAAGKAKLSMQVAGNRQSVQNEQVDTLLKEKPKSLAVGLILPTAAGLIIDRAKAAIVPLVLFGARPGIEAMKKWDKVYFVGSRVEQAASLEGGTLEAWWKGNRPASESHRGRLRFVYLGGTDSMAAACAKAIADAGGAEELLARIDSSGREAGEREMRKVLAVYGRRLDAVACGNDDTALGVLDVLRAGGIRAGRKSPAVVGIGASDEALGAIADGRLLGSAQDDIGSQARAIVDLSVALATSSDPESTGWPLADGKYVWVPYRMVTAKNLADFRK